MGEDTWGPQRCEFHVELKRGVSGEDEEAAEKEIREIVEKFPGARNPSVMKRFFPALIASVKASAAKQQAWCSIFFARTSMLPIRRRGKLPRCCRASRNGSADVQVQSPPGVPRKFAIDLKPERFNSIRLSAP